MYWPRHYGVPISRWMSYKKPRSCVMGLVSISLTAWRIVAANGFVPAATVCYSSKGSLKPF